MALTAAKARAIALSFEGATERRSQGGPVIEIGGAFFARIGTREPDTVMLRTESLDERDAMIQADPALFYVTDHFKTYKGLLARLSALDAKTFRALLEARRRVLAATKPAKPAKPRRGRW